MSAAAATEATPLLESTHHKGAYGTQRRKREAHALKDLLHPVHIHLTVAKGIAVVAALCSIVPYFGLIHLGQVIMSAHNSGLAPSLEALTPSLTMIFAGLGARIGFFALALGITHWADIILADSIRRRIIATISRAPLSWFSQSASGRIRKAVQNDTLDVHFIVAHKQVEYSFAIGSALFGLIWCFSVDWRLALLAFLPLPLYILFTLTTMKDLGPKTQEMDEKLANVSARIVEFIQGITVVKAFGRTGQAHDRFQRATTAFTDFYIAWCGPLLRASALATTAISPAVILSITLTGGTVMAAAGWVDPLYILVVALVAITIPEGIESLTNAEWSNQIAAAAAHRISTILSAPSLPETDNPRTPEGNAVSFHEVTFNYGSHRVLDNVTIDLAPGSITALVGPSGSGKSTLATLLARFNDPLSGRITVGGVDVRDIAPQELYRHIAFVLQDAQLLELSIRDNIRLARPDATEEEVIQAAQAAHIDEEIRVLPRGYDTVIGRDTRLSGGQSQRIAIARALLANAPILILDEATAMSDPESEARIQDALSALVKGRTVLLIAHRVNAVSGADQVVFLQQGRVIATGTHRELLRRGDYAALWPEDPTKDTPEYAHTLGAEAAATTRTEALS